MHSMGRVLLGYPDGGRIAILPTDAPCWHREGNLILAIVLCAGKNKRMNAILRQQGVHMPFPMRRGRARTIDTCACARRAYTTQSAGALTTHYGPLSG